MANRKSIGTGNGPNRQNVQVFCRIRPTNQKEIANGGYTCVKHGDTNVEVNADEGQNKFSFDRIFGMESKQVDVFNDTAGPLIGDVLSGYNATIFAYGQTGTGKTHTMEGNIYNVNEKGIIPRAVEALFEGVCEADENLEFTFKVSYVEIYLEKIRDLLDEHHLKVNLMVREDKIKGIYIAGVTEEYVTSGDELLSIMNKGAANRATAATGMNEGSSRSHSVFTITVSQKDVVTSATKSGKLVLVDLAGSEMVRKTNASGQQLEEAKTINKSLSALGQVINALTDDKSSHIPYRDSKLTRVLQDSLGGNSKTALIVAISPSSFNASETVSTLRFGTRAKSIENKVTINQTRSIEELESLLVRAEKAIDAQTAHIINLSTQLQAALLQIAHYEGNGVMLAAAVSPSSSPRVNRRSSSLHSNTDSDAAVATAAAGEEAADIHASSEDSEEQCYEEDVVDDTAANHDYEEEEESNDEDKIAAGGSNVLMVDRAQRDAEAIALQGLQTALIQMQETVQQLTSELDEERQESNRKSDELQALNVLLKEKDRLAVDAALAMTEVQRSNDTLRERAEQTLHEKIAAIGELEGLRASMEEEAGKMKYSMLELEVTMNTITAENKQLKQEIAEMSGDSNSNNDTSATTTTNNDNDDEEDHGTASTKKPSAVPSLVNNSSNNNNTGATTDSRRSLQLTPGIRNNTNLSSGTDDGEQQQQRILSSDERKQLLEVSSEQFATICMQYKLEEQTSADLYAVMDGYAEAMDRCFAAQQEKAVANDKAKGRRLRELEEQRHRLERDLQGRIENMIQLQIQFDTLTRLGAINNNSNDNKQLVDALAGRDQQHLLCLQQRLEQLVAVHRQLLRKFASLELENAELKQKTKLRDDRIRQLEGNAKGLIKNVRLQAERHAAELSHLKEAIMIMKSEHEFRLETFHSQGSAGGSGSVTMGGSGGVGGSHTMMSGAAAGWMNNSRASVIIGGGGRATAAAPPKSLRGGGGAATSRSFYPDHNGGGGSMMMMMNNNNSNSGTGFNYSESDNVVLPYIVEPPVRNNNNFSNDGPQSVAIRNGTDNLSAAPVVRDDNRNFRNDTASMDNTMVHAVPVVTAMPLSASQDEEENNRGGNRSMSTQQQQNALPPAPPVVKSSSSMFSRFLKGQI